MRRLPLELLELIFGKLSLQALKTVMCVCSTWRILASRMHTRKVGKKVLSRWRAVKQYGKVFASLRDAYIAICQPDGRYNIEPGDPWQWPFSRLRIPWWWSEIPNTKPTRQGSSTIVPRDGDVFDGFQIYGKNITKLSLVHRRKHVIWTHHTFQKDQVHLLLPFIFPIVAAWWENIVLRITATRVDSVRMRYGILPNEAHRDITRNPVHVAIGGTSMLFAMGWIHYKSGKYYR